MLTAVDDIPEVLMTGADQTTVPENIPKDVGPPSILLKEGHTFLLPLEARSSASSNADEHPDTPVYYPLSRDRSREVEDGGVWFFFKNPGGKYPCRMFAPHGLISGKDYVTVVWNDTLYACVRRATDAEARAASLVVSHPTA